MTRAGNVNFAFPAFPVTMRHVIMLIFFLLFICISARESVTVPYSKWECTMGAGAVAFLHYETVGAWLLSLGKVTSEQICGVQPEDICSQSFSGHGMAEEGVGWVVYVQLSKSLHCALIGTLQHDGSRLETLVSFSFFEFHQRRQTQARASGHVFFFQFISSILSICIYPSIYVLQKSIHSMHTMWNRIFHLFFFLGPT